MPFRVENVFKENVLAVAKYSISSMTTRIRVQKMSEDYKAAKIKLGR